MASHPLRTGNGDVYIKLMSWTPALRLLELDLCGHMRCPHSFLRQELSLQLPSLVFTHLLLPILLLGGSGGQRCFFILEGESIFWLFHLLVSSGPDHQKCQ